MASYLSSFCGVIPFAFMVASLIMKLTLDGETWMLISALFISVSILGLVFSIQSNKQHSSNTGLVIIALNGINVMLYLLNFIAYMG
ncbi:MAG: hypothetical protein AAGU02_00145 [Lawsonibacter sp.]